MPKNHIAHDAIGVMAHNLQKLDFLQELLCLEEVLDRVGLNGLITDLSGVLFLHRVEVHCDVGVGQHLLDVNKQAFSSFHHII